MAHEGARAPSMSIQKTKHPERYLVAAPDLDIFVHFANINGVTSITAGTSVSSTFATIADKRCANWLDTSR